jgi:hypothetical protein
MIGDSNVGVPYSPYFLTVIISSFTIIRLFVVEIDRRFIMIMRLIQADFNFEKRGEWTRVMKLTRKIIIIGDSILSGNQVPVGENL